MLLYKINFTGIFLVFDILIPKFFFKSININKKKCD